MPNQTNKFRASYSILEMWQCGNWDMAIGQYFKLKKFQTEAMTAGQDIHKLWEKEVTETKKLPAVFGGKELIAPKPEFKTVVPIHDWLDLVGVIDILDEPTIYEFKSGKTSSEVHSNSMQTGIYGVLATYAGILVNKAEIYHLDQYSGKTDMSIVWLTDKLLQEASDWIETYACEMHNYFIENDLYNKFGGNLEQNGLNRN
jgi:hypothetical protein